MNKNLQVRLALPAGRPYQVTLRMGIILGTTFQFGFQTFKVLARYLNNNIEISIALTRETLPCRQAGLKGLEYNNIFFVVYVESPILLFLLTFRKIYLKTNIKCQTA